jgi:hypothetical protein
MAYLVFYLEEVDRPAPISIESLEIFNNLLFGERFVRLSRHERPARHFKLFDIQTVIARIVPVIPGIRMFEMNKQNAQSK